MLIFACNCVYIYHLNICLAPMVHYYCVFQSHSQAPLDVWHSFCIYHNPLPPNVIPGSIIDQGLWWEWLVIF